MYVFWALCWSAEVKILEIWEKYLYKRNYAEITGSLRYKESFMRKGLYFPERQAHRLHPCPDSEVLENTLCELHCADKRIMGGDGTSP